MSLSDQLFVAEIETGMIVEEHGSRTQDGALTTEPIVYRREANGITKLSPFAEEGKKKTE